MDKEYQKIINKIKQHDITPPQHLFARVQGTLDEREKRSWIEGFKRMMQGPRLAWAAAAVAIAMISFTTYRQFENYQAQQETIANYVNEIFMAENGYLIDFSSEI